MGGVPHCPTAHPRGLLLPQGLVYKAPFWSSRNGGRGLPWDGGRGPCQVPGGSLASDPGNTGMHARSLSFLSASLPHRWFSLRLLTSRVSGCGRALEAADVAAHPPASQAHLILSREWAIKRGLPPTPPCPPQSPPRRPPRQGLSAVTGHDSSVFIPASTTSEG